MAGGGGGEKGRLERKVLAGWAGCGAGRRGPGVASGWRWQHPEGAGAQRPVLAHSPALSQGSVPPEGMVGASLEADVNRGNPTSPTPRNSACSPEKFPRAGSPSPPSCGQDRTTWLSMAPQGLKAPCSVSRTRRRRRAWS